MATDTGVEHGPTRQDMEEGRRRERVEKLAEEMRHKKKTEEDLEKYEKKLKNAEDQEQQVQKIKKDRVEKIKKLVGLGETDNMGKKKEPLTKRIGRGVIGVVDAIGPNPFGRTETRGKKGTVRTRGFSPSSINSGFSSGGFPSFGGGGFGDSGLSPAKFPTFSMGGGFGKQKGGGMSSGLGGGLGLGSGMKFGGSPFAAPAPTKHRRRRPTKRRHKR